MPLAADCHRVAEMNNMIAKVKQAGALFHAPRGRRDYDVLGTNRDAQHTCDIHKRPRARFLIPAQIHATAFVSQCFDAQCAKGGFASSELFECGEGRVR
jgi:hypothetical protein